MRDLLKKIDSNKRLSMLAFGVLGSLLASAITNYSSLFFSLLGKSTLGILNTFINSRYAKAATLETTNYSYFLLALTFVVVVFFMGRGF